MSDVGKALRTYLLTKSTVTDLVSTRIYPDVLEQAATLPALVYNVIGQPGEHHMGGASAVALATVQLDCYASTRAAVNNVEEQCRLVLQGYRGTMGAEYIQTCHLQTRIYSYDAPVDASDSGRYRYITRWLIGLTETAPSL